MATLSIVIPVLNEAAAIQHTLRLLRTQRLRHGASIEVIVVDGGSMDDTVALAMPLADKVLHAAAGRATQMNAGAAAASAEVLLFLHADTILPEQGAALVMDGLRAGRHAWGRFDVRIAGKPAMLRVVAACMNLRSRLSGIATGDQAIFVRREDFCAVGGFPEQPLMEDIELSARLKLRSRPLCLKEKVTTSGRRWESRGVWRTIFLMWSLRLRYWMGTDTASLARAYR